MDIGVKYQVLTDKDTAFFAIIKKKNKTGQFIEEIQKISIQNQKFNN